MKGSDPIFIDNHSDIGVLMLHGFSSTPHEFKELSVFLSEKGFNLYAPLIAGHGTSPEDLRKTNPDDWLQSVREAYGKLKETSKKVFIIGNSFGSNLGFWLIKELNNEPNGIVTLDAPIFLRNHFFILLRLYSYGLLKKYYKKPARVYKADYIDLSDTVTYSVIPIKSLRQFLTFIKKETIPNLSKIKVPALIAHSDTDPIINPSSATYIYKNIQSDTKEIYWVIDSNIHAFTVDGRRMEVFHAIIKFIEKNL